MDVLLTGACGTVGTAVSDHLDHEFSLLDKQETDDIDYVADVTDYDAIRPAFDGVEAIVHLAEYPATDASEATMFDNMRGTANVLRAAREAGVEQVVYASSNHAQGMYEIDNAPDIYDPDFDIVVDHTDPVRPDSFYGTGKVFGEAIGRQYVELHDDGPAQFHALRICTVRSEAYDHPTGDAEAGVDDGRFERGSEEYEAAAARMRAMWHSRRDVAQLVECCLQYDRPGFDVFYGVSDNDARWFDLAHARETIGYEPLDSGDEGR